LAGPFATLFGGLAAINSCTSFMLGRTAAAGRWSAVLMNSASRANSAAALLLRNRATASNDQGNDRSRNQQSVLVHLPISFALFPGHSETKRLLSGVVPILGSVVPEHKFVPLCRFARDRPPADVPIGPEIRKASSHIGVSRLQHIFPILEVPIGRAGRVRDAAPNSVCTPPLTVMGNQHLPLNHAAIANASVLHNRPCPMLLAILATNLGAQKHDADSRVARGRVGRHYRQLRKPRPCKIKRLSRSDAPKIEKIASSW
jgi:hypothetical protein